MTARNPYVIGVPLTEGGAFYGRQEFFKFINDVLEAEKQNVIVLYGQRRIGKTSVLHRAARWLEKQGAFFPVYYDLQGKERLRLDEVLENLAQTLARRLGLPEPDAKDFDDGGRYFADEFLPAAFRRLGEARLVLLVDEFDVLGDELASPGTASETLFPYLQALIVNRPQVGFVFVVGRRIEELATHFQAIFKQAVYRRVGHLSPDESRALILEPSKDIVSFDDEAVGAIQKLAAGHPYFTQLICFEAFNAVKGNGNGLVTAGVVENVVTRAIESGHGALNWFWEGLPRAERFILSAVAHVSDASGFGSKDDMRHLLERHRILLSGLELKDAPDRLVEWEMLHRSGPDAYQFVVELVRRWVIQEHPLSSARRDIDYVNKRAVRLFENAREAHSENDLPYARDEYRRALNANPNHSGAQLGLAITLYELGDIENAIPEFERAYLIDEMSARDGLVRARLARAKALESQQRQDQALAEYGQVLRLVSTDETALQRVSEIWQGRAEAAVDAGNLGSARELFREALKHDARQDLPVRIQAALTAYADRAAASNRHEDGADSYKLLLELFPERVEFGAQAAALLLKSGDALEAAGQLEEGVGAYERAAVLFPDDQTLVARIGAVRERIEARDAVSSLFDRSIAAHRAGRFAEARDGWKKLIQLDVLSYQGENIGTLLSETISPAPVAARPSVSPAKPASPPKPEPQPAIESDAPADVAEINDDGVNFATQRGRGVEDPRDVAEIDDDDVEIEDEGTDEAAESAGPEPDAEKASGGSLLLNPPAEADRSYLRKIALALGALGIAVVFFVWPASPVGVHVSQIETMRVGRPRTLAADLLYSSSWRRRDTSDISKYSFTWTSSDPTIVTVDSWAWLLGLKPGVAWITARYGDVSGSARIEVLPWAVPPLWADFSTLRFFAADPSLKLPDISARKYSEVFDAVKDRAIFLDVTLQIETAALAGQPQSRTAPSAYVLSRSVGGIVADQAYTLTLPGDWTSSTATWTAPLPFVGQIPRDTYRVDYKYEGKVIGSSTFTVR